MCLGPLRRPRIRDTGRAMSCAGVRFKETAASCITGRFGVGIGTADRSQRRITSTARQRATRPLGTKTEGCRRMVYSRMATRSASGNTGTKRAASQPKLHTQTRGISERTTTPPGRRRRPASLFPMERSGNGPIGMPTARKKRIVILAPASLRSRPGRAR